MITSYSFIKMLAAEIVKEPQFHKMNFSSIIARKKISGFEILSNCKASLECATDAITNYLGPLYSLEQGLTDDRYKLTVNTLDEMTSFQISKALVRVIEKKRIEVRQYLINKEISSVTKLIAESRDLLEKQDSFSLIEEEEKTSQKILELKERLKIYQSSLSVEVENMSSLEAKIVENRRVLNKSKQIGGFSKTKSRLMQQKIADLRSNIVAFSSIPEENRSKADSLILEQLKDELSSLEHRSPAEGSLKNQEIEEAFGDSQRGKENDFKFDYLVSKNKVASLQADYEKFQQELSELQKNKVSREAVIEKFKSELEFIKNLEAKQLSLKLMSSTMTSDLQFEDSGKNIEELRKLSLLKTFSFALFISLFLVILSLVLRYLFDDTIYTQDDILPYLQGLDFIGEAPSFE